MGGRRPRLSRDDIALTALDILDSEGLSALTMRHLAARLGVRAASLYNHVSGYDEIIDLIQDLVNQEIDLDTLRAQPGVVAVFTALVIISNVTATKGVAFGPVNPDQPYRPKSPDELRCTIGECTFGIWNELAYQLYIDVKALFEAVQAMDDNSLRYYDLWEALKEFTKTTIDTSETTSGSGSS